MILATEDVSKVYWPGTSHEVRALVDVSLEIPRGGISLIRGPSGSGKTTLLCLLGALLRPSAGRVLLDGRDLTRLSDAALTRVRRSTLGFVFQDSCLIPRLPAWQNVSYPLIPCVPSEAERRERAFGLLRDLGLEGRGLHAPEELSGGEQQRVAIARALVAGPELLLADEPTSNIDEASSVRLVSILEGLRRDGMTILAVSHDSRLEQCADHVFVMEAGKLARA